MMTISLCNQCKFTVNVTVQFCQGLFLMTSQLVFGLSKLVSSKQIV